MQYDADYHDVINADTSIMALSSEDEVSQTTDLAYFQGQYDDYMLQLKYDEVYATLLTSRYSLSLTYLLTHLTTNSLTHSQLYPV